MKFPCLKSFTIDLHMETPLDMPLFGIKRLGAPAATAAASETEDKIVSQVVLAATGNPDLSQLNPDLTQLNPDLSQITSGSVLPEPSIEPAASASSLRIPVVSASTATLPAPSAAPAAAGCSDSAGQWVLKKTSKLKRCEDFYKTHWPQPPEEPGEVELSALRAVWVIEFFRFTYEICIFFNCFFLIYI
jgi:hypothetical protein